jgi:tetratricopeptide (TPR) repeat protein
MNRAFIGVVICLALLGHAPDLPAEPAQSTPTTAPEQPFSPDQVAEGQFGFGVQLMRDHKWAGAAQAFERAVNARTNFPQAYNNWGISLVQLGKQGLTGPEQLQSFQAAAEKFSKAAAQKPDDKLTYILWSETLLLIGDLPVDSRTRLACYQGAVEKCRKAVDLAPDDWESYNKWAVILSTKLPDYAVNNQARLQLYKEAAALFAKAADHARFGGEISTVCDNWAGALVRAAQVSTDRVAGQSLLREALEKFERAARAQPGAAATYTMWGNALIDLGKVSRLRGDFRDAIEKFNTSLALRPDDPATLYSLARVYAQLDDPVMAVQNLRKCFDVDTSRLYRQSASQDADLATLRGTPEFDELMGKPGPRGLPNNNPHLSDRPQ